MANPQEDKRFLGIKKETYLKVAGWGAVGLLALALLAAL